MKNEGSATVPLETMSASKNRVYGLVNNTGTLKSLVFFDKTGSVNARLISRTFTMARNRMCTPTTCTPLKMLKCQKAIGRITERRSDYGNHPQESNE